jgi:predicted nucleotidyltransferase
VDISNPMSCVVPSAHGPVLAVLAGTTTPLTGRTIAELSHPRVSQPRVARILRDLTAAGLVHRTPAGSSSLFVLNREHLAAGAVESLTTLRQQLWTRIAEHARAWSHPPLAVVAFGSAARGDGDTASDIDLLVVRPSTASDDDSAWQEDVTDLAARVGIWTGNPCEVLDRSEDELVTMATHGERLLTEIRRDGRAIVGSLTTVPLPAEVA